MSKLISFYFTILILLFMSSSNLIASESQNYNEYLNKYVSFGVVDYKEMKSEVQILDKYLAMNASISSNEFLSWSNDRQLAFYFNIYNAATIKLILDNYPISTIKDIGSFFKGPWKQKVVNIFGKKYTLDELEHDLLRKEYDEARLHMALVCAAKGCPPLRSEIYTSDNLNQQLNDQAAQFLKNKDNFKIDKKSKIVYFSSIFKWYGDDFISKYLPVSGFEGLSKKERAVANFCIVYLNQEDREYIKAGGYNVKYLKYDWALNEEINYQ